MLKRRNVIVFFFFWFTLEWRRTFCPRNIRRRRRRQWRYNTYNRNPTDGGKTYPTTIIIIIVQKKSHWKWLSRTYVSHRRKKHLVSSSKTLSDSTFTNSFHSCLLLIMFFPPFFPLILLYYIKIVRQAPTKKKEWHGLLWANRILPSMCERALLDDNDDVNCRPRKRRLKGQT